MGPAQGRGQRDEARRQLRHGGDRLPGSRGLGCPDLQHSGTEARRLRVGKAADGRVLMVAYTLRRTNDGETIRIISARRERTAYRGSDQLQHTNRDDSIADPAGWKKWRIQAIRVLTTSEGMNTLILMDCAVRI